ncbi:methyl-accepting chemotaxis protein [Acidovorax sp.]|uniref:methyl-accepting chemotaxis protein n=1 Tax=Acidovorax sp. TaxID=1872122 RepID=UPI002ACEFC63|nr:methyl-accepting chemotaxis protein [Acidovorax sp.]MDZ7863035.1 methyl-accepting chemotaxis protein [Acidovorax sp.]
MRLNLPTTGQEYAVPKGQTLVSATDTQGRITHCNAAFVAVSGYTRDELVGQPHNMIRHPDMPEEAFRDMWATIASGRPWSAPVKNRRKNGDHYWVMANATPLMQDGRPVGYMSVRTEATRAQIAAAEQLYATMREEKQAGRRVHGLRSGRVVRHTLAGRVAHGLATLGLSARLALALLALLAASLATGMLLPGAAGWAVLLALFGTAWWYLARLLVGPIAALTLAANRVAAGDLTTTMRRGRNDELGDLEQALGQLSFNLCAIVRDARDESESMRLGAQEIAQGNLDLSARTESQAASLEQTAASMEQITGTVRQSADAARQATALAGQADAAAARSREAVDSVGQTMRDIQGDSERIGEITQVIDSIAFQTNILALNAAVEAARAGEQGRGFAVVASEVRSLAGRSAAAAREIKQLIDQSAHRVEQGQQRTQAAQATMVEVVEGVQRVSAVVGEISHASQEQLTGISEVNTAVGQLDTITQENAALVEQVAAAAQGLTRTAGAVTDSVQVFRLEAGLPSAARAAVLAPGQRRAVTVAAQPRGKGLTTA